MEGDGLVIQMDGNVHAGPALIKGDPNKQNGNGLLFCEFLERNPELIVVNSLEQGKENWKTGLWRLFRPFFLSLIR